MVTKKISRAFNLLAAVVIAGLLAGCLPPGPKALVEGRRRLERGDLPRAIENLETATRLMSTNAHAWNFLGIAYHQSGDVAQAERAYQSALKVDRNLLEARLNLGNLWLENGRATDAKTEFTAYTLRRPSGAEGFERLAAAELRLRELASAEAHARKAVDLAPADPAALNTLGLTLQQRGKGQEAAQSFASALRSQPGFAPALLNLAVVTHRQMGDLRGALKLYRQYVALKPQPADANDVLEVIKQLEVLLFAPAPGSSTANLSSPPSVSKVAASAGGSLNPANSSPQAAVKAPASNTVSSTSTVAIVSPVSASRPATKPVGATPAPVPRRADPPPSVPRSDRVEVVTLPPEPVIRTPVDQASAPKPVVTTNRASAVAAQSPTVSGGTAKQDRSFIESVNPLRLFRREPKPDSNVIPQANSTAPSPSVSVVVTSPPPPAVVTPTAAPSSTASRPTAGFQRYEYRSGFTVVSGDRAKAEVLLSQGNAAMKTKDVTEAVTAFRDAAQTDPGWYQAHFNYAAAALEIGRVTEALSAGETAVALRPDSSDARYNFALALRQGNYVLDSAAQLEKLLTMEPEDVRAHLALGNLYANQLRLKDKARDHYQKVLKLAPRHPQAQSIRYWLLSNPR